MSEPKYRSAYGGGEVSAPQRITEVVCTHIARERGAELPSFFWKLPAWTRDYRSQVMHANRLLKIYDAEAILAMLDKNPRIRSLGPAFVSGLVVQEQEAIDRMREAAAKSASDGAGGVQDPTSRPRPATPRKGSLKSKLK